MISNLTIFSTSAIAVDTVVKCSTDPTGAVPYFATSALDAVTPGSWVAGSWGVAYNSTTDRATARSATIGDGAQHDINSGSSYRLWCKVTIGAETFVEPVAIISCP